MFGGGGWGVLFPMCSHYVPPQVVILFLRFPMCSLRHSYRHTPLVINRSVISITSGYLWRSDTIRSCLPFFFSLHLDGLKTPIYFILFLRIQATKKRKRVRKGMKTPPNHKSGRASKLSKPSLLSLFSPFLRSSREEKNLTNFSSFLLFILLLPSSPSLPHLFHNKPNVLFGTQAQSKKLEEAKRKAKN